jgi:FMN-dependent NADH-azoreductase
MTTENRQSMEENMIYSDQLLAADYVVIATPMYNFSVPAVLKSWIDHIVVSQKTFKYVEGKQFGLTTNVKKVILITSSTMPLDMYAGWGMDHLRPFIKTVMSYIGINEIENLNFVDKNEDHNQSEYQKLETAVAAI